MVKAQKQICDENLPDRAYLQMRMRKGRRRRERR